MRGTTLQLSDDALALRFTEKHIDRLRFTPELEYWLEWSGSRWERDQRLKVLTLARELCREVAELLRPLGKKSDGIGSAHTVTSVVALARADQRHIVMPDQWDSDPFLLGTPQATSTFRLVPRTHRGMQIT